MKKTVDKPVRNMYTLNDRRVVTINGKSPERTVHRFVHLKTLLSFSEEVDSKRR